MTAFRQCVLGAGMMVVFEYLLRLDLSRFFVAIFGAVAWVLMCLFRLNAGRALGLMRREFGARHFVMIVGMGEPARALGRQLEEAARFGIRLTGFLTDQPGEPHAAEIELENRYPVHSLDSLPELLKANVIDEIIFAVDSPAVA